MKTTIFRMDRVTGGTSSGMWVVGFHLHMTLGELGELQGNFYL